MRYTVLLERVEKVRYSAEVTVEASSEQEAGMLGLERADSDTATWRRPRLLDEFVNVTSIEATL